MDEKFQKLTDREHMLLRPAMYIGSVTPEETTRFVFETQKKITVSTGLLKIVNELIDNSVDEYIRAGFPKKMVISVHMTRESVTVEDNGRGIPVEKYNGQWRPQVAWTEAKAGTSFSVNRVGPGANGVGSVVANVFSQKFIGITRDGKNQCIVSCSDNMNKIKTKVSTNTDPTGTKVTIEPDFERFGITEFSQDYFDMIEGRLTLLAVTYPDICFKFNDVLQNVKPKTYFERYGNDPVVFEGDDFVAAILPSDEEEYVQRSAIDGLDLIQGGTHETIISRELSYALRELIRRKHKIDLSPLEIKRGLKLIFIGKNFPNMEFESQTKEKLTNAEKDVKAWLGDIDYEKLAKKVFREESIIEPIIRAKLAKQMAAEQRAVALAMKKQAKKHVEKHIEAKAKDKSKRRLIICEGDSAIGALLKIRDPQIHGGFPLRGVPMNTFGATEKEMLDNKELANIMSILGLKFHMKGKELEESLEYGLIGIFCDADYDGAFIATTLINFLYHWPDLFTQHRVFLIRSPRYILTKGKGANKKIIYFYDTESFEKSRQNYKGYEIRYAKGLATLRDCEYAESINNEENWIEVEIDDPKALEIMYSDNVQARKELMSI